ncbi:MAG TPA: peroxiredoxin [Actinopolymorphaceae bacterium]
MARAVGEPAPDFELPDQHGVTTTLRGLRDLAPRGQVAIVFFPFAHTGVCSSELRAIQQDLSRFEERGTQVVAVSCDTMVTQRVFAEAEGFTFRLLSDFWPHGATASAYGVFDDERGCALRGTFLVDGDGVVRWRVVNDLPEARTLEDLLGVL